MNVLTVSMDPVIRKADGILLINNIQVPKVEGARLLGSSIDSHMHFAEHAKKARGKCFGKL